MERSSPEQPDVWIESFDPLDFDHRRMAVVEATFQSGLLVSETMADGTNRSTCSRPTRGHLRKGAKSYAKPSTRFP